MSGLSSGGGGVPAGTIISVGKGVPAGFLECNGATLNRATYAALFKEIDTKWGVGNGSTTFAIPDFRGEFLRGLDSGRGVDSGRALATFQDATGIDDQVLQTITLYMDNVDKSYSYIVRTSAPGQTGTARGFYKKKVRVRNQALRYCIKY